MWTDKKDLNQRVEAFINGEANEVDLGLDGTTDARERFAIRSAKRLVNSFKLYREQSCDMGDLLGALRCYLLALQVQIRIDSPSLPRLNDFGILLDANTSKYYATFDLPSYVNEKFVADAFLVLEHVQSKRDLGLDLHTDPYIKALTGFGTFKTLAQKLAVSGALATPAGFTTLISLPTGGGKSLITQSMAYQQEGLTIAIVPTVSLSIDQVRVAKQIVKSDSVDSEVFSYRSGVDPSDLIAAINDRTARLLFVSPEAVMGNTQIKQAIARANEARYLRNIIIDEAHIVVDWGALFRVDYQCLECWRRDLLLKNPGIRTVLLSATFEERCAGILKQLFCESDEKWIEIRCDSLRHEPRFMHIRTKTEGEKDAKALELVKKLPHPLVVYVASPYEANRFASHLRNQGIRNVKTFTGQTNNADRMQLIEDWADDKLEIMVATSAFGVGVDKSDVRTVLHLYVPENANAYYQELGRGGRDRLPCLSVMCTCPSDASASFGRISKRVLKPDKIVGRWSSMYHSKESKLQNDLIYIDTSVKPFYSDDDPFEDAPASEKHKTWNIFVLLFLRRNGLLEICDIQFVRDKYQQKYIFVVRIIDNRLRSEDDELKELIERLRSEEWEYYSESFKTIRRALQRTGTECWSEMFFDTYHYVSEFCAGCDEHAEPNSFDSGVFPLQKRLARPLRTFDQEQLALFGSSENLVIVAQPSEQGALFSTLSRYRISALVVQDGTDIDSLIDSIDNTRSGFIVLNDKLLKELVRRNALYYLSGIVVVRYGKGTKGTLALQKYISSAFDSKPFTKVVHVIEEDYYFESVGKRFTDIVDGPVKPLRAIV